MNNIVKKKLRNGDTAIGSFIGFHSPSMIEMLGYAGFDFVVIDNEHGPFSWGEVEDMVRAAELTNIAPFVRVAYDPSDIQKALDRGAKGIHVPMVNTKEQAELVVERAKYPPLGKRGAAFSIRSAKFGKDGGPSYLTETNNEVFIAVHIETPEAVENIESLMSVQGIDVFYIGPTDLSVTMGVEGPEHPDVQKAMNHVLETGRRLGVNVGIQVGGAKAVDQKLQWGAKYIGVGITPILYSAFDEVVKAGSINLVGSKHL
jgi:4-hydroxy-2-oxoheptanedioate aldolase